MAAPNMTVVKLQEAIKALTERIEKLEGRMQGYEDQANVNHKILERVDKTVSGYERTIKRFIRFLQWGGGIAVTAVVGQAVVFIFHLFGH